MTLWSLNRGQVAKPFLEMHQAVSLPKFKSNPLSRWSLPDLWSVPVPLNGDGRRQDGTVTSETHVQSKVHAVVPPHLTLGVAIHGPGYPRATRAHGNSRKLTIPNF